jgi:ATP-dependent Clp protease ATP-binding subunit ClpA
MTMGKLLDDQRLHTELCEPRLAVALGASRNEEGSKLLAFAIELGHELVRLRDVLYCLVSGADSEANRALVRELGRKPRELIEGIESAFDAEGGAPPIELKRASVDPQVVALFERVEAMTEAEGVELIPDLALTIALLELADAELSSMLDAWLGDGGLAAVKRRLRAKWPPLPTGTLFDGGGRIDRSRLHPDGARFLERLAEDAKSLNVPRLTSRHVLYSLLGRDAAPLKLALDLRLGLDAKRELHARLARELVRRGQQRAESFAITRDTVTDSVRALLDYSLGVALDRGERKVTEADIAAAFVSKQPAELERLLDGGAKLDVVALRDYLRGFEAEEGKLPLAALPIAEIDSALKKRVIGQDSAIGSVLPWIKRLRFGIPRDGRPAAVLLFLGPTGTGKTQLAKELARHVYGAEDRMIFVEMGQFQSKESMSGLIGAPPGYVGYGEGILTNGLAEKPECVVLFDEIEKAHVQVFDVLLRFADEGVISDPAGPVRDGSRCIIVMTTNAGQGWLRKELEQRPKRGEDPQALIPELFAAAMEELRQAKFRPEFLGRVDERICFVPFTLATCAKIVERVLDDERSKFKRIKNVTLDVHPKVLAFLAEMAFERSRDEGARGAPRAVNQHIVTPAIDALTRDDELGAAGKTVSVQLRDGNVVLEVRG